ncbi:MAG: GEVED domain-containing protein [Raineya sp.]|jgi:hypothetical protein|nr:GEVED domain-containing protein [Raineya sp.]
MKKIIALGFAALMAGATYAQRSCHSMEVLEHNKQHDHQLEQKMFQIERVTDNYLQNKANQRVTGVVRIPVVVHVIYNSAVAAENISDAQIQSQIAVLNEDFRKTNTDVSQVPSLFAPLAVDTEIEFFLATTSPTGTATTGITRKSSTRTSWGTADAMKSTTQGGVAPWDATRYLNIWVCNIGGGILGYAQFPGGSTSTDGVVISPQYFGSSSKGTGFYLSAPFDKGRTATHEVGHWLNLRHIWGDANCGNDFVADTPTQQTSNGGCPTFPKPTCGNTSDMWMNYMDYTDDRCMYMFSAGQKDRMRATFETGGGRTGFVSGTTPPPTCATPASLTTSSITSTGATLNWGTVSGAASYDVRVRATGATTWTDFLGRTGTSLAVTGLTASTNYEWQIRTNCSGSSSAYSSSITFTTTTGTVTPAYCASRGTNNTYEWIDLVRLGSINRTSSRETNGYLNTGLSTNLIRGTSQTVSYSAGFSSTAYTEYWKVYIDWNRDGDFLDAGETVVNRTSSSSATLSSTFTVPSTAALGQTRMRVSMSDASQNSCSTFTYGEVEDYTINVTATAREDISAQLENPFGVEIYPNPANTIANIKLSGAEGSNSVQIYDMAGRTVFTASIEGNNELSVDLSRFEKGLYIINITTDKGVTERKKLLVQK